MRKSALAALLVSTPGLAAACATCFGAGGDQKGLLDGIWWGIVLLIAVVMSCVGGIAYALWKIEKKKIAEEAAA